MSLKILEIELITENLGHPVKSSSDMKCVSLNIVTSLALFKLFVGFVRGNVAKFWHIVLKHWGIFDIIYAKLPYNGLYN